VSKPKRGSLAPASLHGLCRRLYQSVMKASLGSSGTGGLTSLASNLGVSTLCCCDLVGRSYCTIHLDQRKRSKASFAKASWITACLSDKPHQQRSKDTPSSLKKVGLNVHTYKSLPSNRLASGSSYPGHCLTRAIKLTMSFKRGSQYHCANKASFGSSGTGEITSLAPNLGVSTFYFLCD
jgi:hypothetical protein